MILRYHDTGADHSHDNLNITDGEKAMRTLDLLLDHWVEHNVTHMEGFEEWAKKAIENDKPEVADAIFEAIRCMQQANEELAKAKELM